MALADVLRERVSRRGRTAQVDCGALGTVTVEALSPRECAALGMSDGGRALLFAACRELQEAGEALRRERRLFTPDEVTQYVSDGEALAAAWTVLALSGVTPEETDSPDKAENRLETVQDSEKDLSEIRLETVQEPDSLPPEAPELLESRLGTVQESGKQFSEIRPGIVQFPEDAPADGQVSREFSRETPSMGAVSHFEPQNLALSEKNSHFMSPLKLSGDKRELSGRMAALHETESEFRATVHETVSEFPGTVHEMKSEFAANEQQALHETESEFQEGLHEITSEFDENRREPLHEMTSELAEKLAAYLLEGLRRAAAVR